MSEVVSEEWGIDKFLKINDSATINDPEYYGAEHYAPEDSGTGHSVFIDPFGNAVSVTNSMNFLYKIRSIIIF